MKHRKWFLLLLVLAALLAACNGTEVPVTNLDALDNDLDGGGRVEAIYVGGMQFNHVCRTDYNTSLWRITSSKTLECSLELVSAPEDTRIQVVHVHVDTSLVSRDEQVDGLTIDSMDDKLSAGDQAGVLVSEEHPYRLIFAIEGFSKDLIDGWMFITGDYGTGDITQKRLTESNLISSGKVYGQKLSFIYKLLVADPGEEYHVETFQDEFYVPVGKSPVVPTTTPQPQ